MKNKYFILLVFLVVSCLQVKGQDATIALWPDKVPNQRTSAEKEKQEQKDILVISNVQVPQIEVFLPSERNATGEAVVIFPGGGYHVLAYDWEGADIAKWLNSLGIAGIVVKYRLPISKSIIEPHKAPLQDAQRAMRLVRGNAQKWNIDSDKIGIIGFSAGGHLASTLGTHFNEEVYTQEDQNDTLSARPDFMVLMYPVITFSFVPTHAGSKKALIGENPKQAMIDHFSNELLVTKDTPPTLLIHAGDDKAVPVENSILFYQALLKNEVAAEMHIYPKGGHGFALAIGNSHLESWKTLFSVWLKNLEVKKSVPPNSPSTKE